MSASSANLRSGTNYVSFAGLTFGLLALALALFHFYGGPFDPPASFEKSVADVAVGIGKAVIAQRAGSKVEDPPPQAKARPMKLDKIVTMVTVAAGFLAIMLAVFARIRREDRRIWSSAAALGIGAIALEYLIILVGVVLFALLVSVVLKGMDFG